jgi:hypothetical protein
MTPAALARPPAVWPLVAPFLVGSVLVASVVYIGVPALAARQVEPLVAWMLLAPPLVFLPVAAYGWWLVRAEGVTDLRSRLWLRWPSPRDWRYGLGGVAVIGVTSAALAWVATQLGLPIHPPGMPPLHALTRETLWVVAVWLLSWPANMLGEELTWRCVVLPRMEVRFGRDAWLLDAALWLVFHLAFGPGNLLVLLPTLVVVPWVTQRRRNAWLGLMLHATLSLPGFVAMALGAA